MNAHLGRMCIVFQILWTALSSAFCMKYPGLVRDFWRYLADSVHGMFLGYTRSPDQVGIFHVYIK